MTMLPKWAIAPAHEKKVVATDKGWVVEETGEILVSFKNLPQHLQELHADVDLFLAQEQENATDTTNVSEPVDVEPVPEEDDAAEPEIPETPVEASLTGSGDEPVKPKPRRGRKPKSK